MRFSSLVDTTSKGVNMKIIFVLMLSMLTIFPNAYANGGASALDEMILHHQRGISKAKETRKLGTHKEVDRVLDEIIVNQERELKQMREMQERLFPENKKTKDVASLSEKFTEELVRMETEMQHMFSDFRSRMDKSTISSTIPKVEVREDKKSYDIKAEVPGMMKDDIKVKVVNNELQIQGRREEETKREEKGLTSSEFKYGEFKRTIQLEEKVDPSSLKLDYKDGVLTVHLSKAKSRSKV